MVGDCAGAIAIMMCLEIGNQLHQAVDIPIPGSVIGMGVLLLLLGTGFLKEEWLKRASGWLLLLLPALFVPLYVVPLADPKFRFRFSETYLPAAAIGAAATLSIVGLIARRMTR
jgi:putative effector of murein hydrolase LrgA (UPF0299 family)